MRKYNQNKPLLRCLRCNHQWQPIKIYISKVCPKCKSPDWRKPEIKKNTQTTTTLTYNVEAGIPGIAKAKIEKKVETVIKPNSTAR